MTFNHRKSESALSLPPEVISFSKSVVCGDWNLAGASAAPAVESLLVAVGVNSLPATTATLQRLAAASCHATRSTGQHRNTDQL